MSSEGAAKKLESELVEVNAKILSIEASIARVESMLGGMPADHQKAYADSMGLAGKEISRAELFKRASEIRSDIKDLKLPLPSREPTGVSSLPHCRILCFPARYTPSAGVVLPHRLPQPSIPWRMHSARLCVACSSFLSLWPSCSCSASPRGHQVCGSCSCISPAHIGHRWRTECVSTHLGGARDVALLQARGAAVVRAHRSGVALQARAPVSCASLALDVRSPAFLIDLRRPVKVPVVVPVVAPPSAVVALPRSLPQPPTPWRPLSHHCVANSSLPALCRCGLVVAAPCATAASDQPVHSSAPSIRISCHSFRSVH
jgi:hypothetical protein